MKKVFMIILNLIIIFTLCACESYDSSLSEIPSDFSTDGSIEENIDELPSEDENAALKGSKDKKVTQNNKPTESKTQSDKRKAKKSEVDKTPSEIQEIIPKSSLPEVKFSAKDSNIRYTDMVSLATGGFAVAGHRNTIDLTESVIRIYDENSKLEREHTFYDGNGFDKVAACSDGGFIAASYCPPCITKINSSFETEWFMPYEDVAFEGTVHDIEEISPDCFAVLFVSVNSPDFSRKLKISFLDKNGTLIETVDLMKNIAPLDADIIPDGSGGFYLLSACNEALANNYDLLKDNYDSSKATEAIIMRFNADRELIWAKTLGGGGNDWVEEGTIDTDGNIYFAVGTDWYGADFFWDMSVERSMPYRRMLVKMDSSGNIVYRVPLSNKGMAVDQVFGIHIKDKKAYVVGMADYFDGYQVKYPCEQIAPSEKGDRVFSVYTACVDSAGTELYRKIFRCDINNTPSDSVLLNNGSLVICGSVSSIENPFDLYFPAGVDRAAALFVYPLFL